MEPFAILLGVISCIQTLERVIEATKHARQFKQQCSELGDMVTLLLRIIQAENITQGDPAIFAENQTAIESASADFQSTFTSVKNTITEIDQLTMKCQEGIIQRGVDFFFTRNVARLKNKLFEWITVCMLSNIVSILHYPQSP
jgi:translation elongation factor EF-1alpha